MNFGLQIDRSLGLPYVVEPASTHSTKPVGAFDNNLLGDKDKPPTRLKDLVNKTAAARKAEVTALLARRTALLKGRTTVLNRGGNTSIEPARELTLTSNFVTGTGITSALEVGFHLDWTTGVPIIPGASLKGMTRAWVSHWASTDDLKANLPPDQQTDDHLDAYHVGIFGEAPYTPTPAELEKNPDLAADPGWAGEVAFLDGIFGPGTEIGLDIMTPHYNSWMLTEGYSPTDPTSVPADWNAPVPVPFAVILPGASLHLAVLPTDRLAVELVPVALNWMCRAIAEIGAGAKTKEGRGRAS